MSNAGLLELPTKHDIYQKIMQLRKTDSNISDIEIRDAIRDHFSTYAEEKLRYNVPDIRTYVDQTTDWEEILGFKPVGAITPVMDSSLDAPKRVSYPELYMRVIKKLTDDVLEGIKTVELLQKL